MSSSLATPAAPRFTKHTYNNYNSNNVNCNLYASSNTAGPSTSTSTSSSIFCSTCLTNQHLVRENLAAYEPPGHLSKPKQDQAEAEYRAGLERRYPEVCSHCVAKARETIKARNHMAKVDNLKRKTEYSRAHPDYDPYQSYKEFVLNIIALVWWLGPLTQMLWHGLEACIAYEKSKMSVFEYFDSIGGTRFAFPPRTQIYSSWIEELISFVWLPKEQYSALITPWLSYSLLASFCTLFYTRRFFEKWTKFKKGRLVGLFNYYLYSLVVLVIRWFILSQLQTSMATQWGPLGQTAFVAAHGFMAVFIPFVSPSKPSNISPCAD